MNVLRFDACESDFDARLKALLAYADEVDEAVESAVRDILAQVRERGDAAILECTARLDGLNAAHVAALEVSKAQMQAALAELSGAQLPRASESHVVVIR